jgi:2'-5' RNA ligase
VPPHVTLLYPFVEPTALDDRIRGVIASIASRQVPFSFEMSGPERWPDTVYAAVAPAAPFLEIHRDLAAAFPDFPIYGRPGFQLIPHVTIAESQFVDDPSVLGDPSWSDLPADGLVTRLEVIVEGADDQWHTVWTIPLGVPGL